MKALISWLIGLGALLAGCSRPASAPSAPSAAAAPAASTGIIRQVDHVLVASGDARDLFSLLADTLQLPVAWPFTDYGGFASGGVSVGNVNLEVLQDGRPTAGPARARFTGFALEPEPLRITVAELDARGVPHGKPSPFRSSQGGGFPRTLWTTLALPEVSGDATQVFLCEYADDVAVRRRRWREQLEAGGGGPLGIRSMGEVVLGVQDLARAKEQWRRLLRPAGESPEGAWTLGAGPALRLVPAARDGIEGLVLVMDSQARARAWLGKQGITSAEQSGTLTLSGARFQGLKLTLAEAVPRGR